mmetsp:Transcript_263/g.582  ORF Transcript_263/g.582 Transcript_263/m.582 type:complete len:505 (-) Transcript_263:39-1553(-)
MAVPGSNMPAEASMAVPGSTAPAECVAGRQFSGAERGPESAGCRRMAWPKRRTRRERTSTQVGIACAALGRRSAREARSASRCHRTAERGLSRSTELSALRERAVVRSRLAKYEAPLESPLPSLLGSCKRLVIKEPYCNTAELRSKSSPPAVGSSVTWQVTCLDTKSQACDYISACPKSHDFKCATDSAAQGRTSCPVAEAGDGGRPAPAACDVALHGKTLALLNKILPSNEATIVAKLCELSPTTSQELTTIAETIFDKALRDPGYLVLYCRAIVKMDDAYAAFRSASVESADGPAHIEEARFAAHVMQLCQAEFQRLLQLCSDAELRRSGSRPSKGREEEFEVRMKRKDRSLAYVAMVGHLFLCGVLSASILAEIFVALLLDVPDQQEASRPVQACRFPPGFSVECACELLSIVAVTMSQSEPEIFTLLLGRLARLKDAQHGSYSGPAGAEAASTFAYATRIRFKILGLLEADRHGCSHPKAAPPSTSTRGVWRSRSEGQWR